MRETNQYATKKEYIKQNFNKGTGSNCKIEIIFSGSAK